MAQGSGIFALTLGVSGSGLAPALTSAHFDPVGSANAPDWITLQDETGFTTREIVQHLFDRVRELEDLVIVQKREAAGVNTIADGGTIPHGLPQTPSVVHVQSTVTGEFAIVTATSRTTFTVAIKTHANGAGTTQPIFWTAKL